VFNATWQFLFICNGAPLMSLGLSNLSSRIRDAQVTPVAQREGADFKEEFIYDNLDRLTTVKQVRTNGFATNVDTLALQYDQVGNITSKTGVGNANLGSYQYKTVQAGCATVAGPHAASLVNGKSYCYDLNGNNTEVRKNGAVIRTIAYTGFDLAESIVRGYSGHEKPPFRTMRSQAKLAEQAC
jgi:hypothetical protein